MCFMSKLQIPQVLNECLPVFRRVWEEKRTACSRQAHCTSTQLANFSNEKVIWRCLTRSKFPFFLISGRKHSISCLVCLPHSSRCWCWLVYVSTAAAGVLVVRSTGDALQGVLCCWGLCCASTGDQPLDAMEAHKKRRVKGDLWLKFHLLILFTNLYPSATLLINDCSWNAMCQQWITYFCCTSVVHG